jgi:hypothetical protein
MRRKTQYIQGLIGLLSGGYLRLGRCQDLAPATGRFFLKMGQDRRRYVSVSAVSEVSDISLSPTTNIPSSHIHTLVVMDTCGGRS